MHRAFRYAGSKRHIVHTINKLLEKIDTSSYIYVEPFLGSGTIYYNLEKNFKKVYLNDIDERICDLHRCFYYEYEDYLEILSYTKEHYGDIKNSKDAYYKLRKAYNEEIDSKSRQLKLLLLANSCINSMLRFGPNGMNQSFGHCHYTLDRATWHHLREKYFKAVLLNDSYLSCLSKADTCNSVIFVDPPYNERIMPYSLNENYIRQELLDRLVSLSFNMNNVIMYTDVDNVESDYLLDYGFTKMKIKELRNICPNRSSEKTMTEVLYCNKL